MANETLQPTVKATQPASTDLDMQALIDEANISEEYVKQYTRDFPQLDNLVDGVPINKDPNTPFVGDTTLAGLVRSIPRSSLKQLPVLSTIVNGSKKTIYAFICNFLLKKTAFNEDTFGKGLLSTLQIATEQALTHGYAPTMSASGQMYNDFGTRMRLLHFSDVSLEPGVPDSNESGYFFVTAHLVPGRLRRLLKNAKANPETTWNVEALEALLQNSPTPDDYNKYQSDPKKIAVDQGATYKLITRYETGPGGNIITFCKDYPDAPLRMYKNKSKWGYPRVQFLVIDPAALTPFGVSRVRLASPNQNFMNIYYGNIAAMLLLNSAPPVFKRGVFLKPTPLKRNALWESIDPNAEISLKMLDNGSLATFPTISAQLAGQIQNIMGGQSNLTNAGSKASPFGKTAPGVEAGQALMTVESQQVTKILENFLRQYGLVALDTLISEQEGEDIIILDDETKDSINILAEQEYKAAPTIDPMTGMPMPFVPPIGADNKYKIIWKELYDAIEEWSVVVDVSLSPDQLKDKTHADLQDMLVALAQNAKDIPGAAEKVQEITNMLMQDKAPLIKPMSTPIMPTQIPAPAQPEAPMEPMAPQA